MSDFFCKFTTQLYPEFCSCFYLEAEQTNKPLDLPA